MISAVRDARVKNGIRNKESINLYIQSDNRADYEPLFGILSRQVNAENIAFTDATVEKCINVLVQKDKLFIETKTELDTTAQKEQLEKDITYLEGFLASVEKKLGNERFVQNAKPEVVDIERKKKADAEEKIAALREALASL
ncbi:hypothetical protein KRR40_07280 [Niabella defluvii]|nr:hypothetical protein KRR40_07280 [Niabella sp. I65]